MWAGCVLSLRRFSTGHLGGFLSCQVLLELLPSMLSGSPHGEASHQGAKHRCETRMLPPDQLGLGRNITRGSQVKQYEADELPTQGLAEFLIHKTLGGDKESCFKHT